MKHAHLNFFLIPTLLLGVSTVAAAPEPETRLSPDAAVAAASELAELLHDNYVFPEIGVRYAEALEARIEQGHYSSGMSPDELANDLETLVNQVHRDAHLRVRVSGAERGGQRRMRRGPGTGGAIGTTTWIDGDVAYLELLALPGDEASQEAMSEFLDEYRGAEALILDARMCPGGTLAVIDVLSSRLYDEPTHLVTMDTRINPNEESRRIFDDGPNMRPAESPASISRLEHWATPSSNPADRSWAQVPVYLLTNLTASACEHLALALKTTDRATLVGATTRGAGHFGGLRSFADGLLNVFLPTGRTFDPVTGEDWEGTGVEPDIEVPADQALEAALTDLGVDPGLASSVTRQRGMSPEVAVRQVNPNRKSYGMGIMPPGGGDTFIEVMMVRPDAAADKAGLQQGDRIVAMNGTSIADMDEASVIKALQSPEIALEIQRSDERFDVQMALE